MTTWTRGRSLLRAHYEARAIPAEEFIASIAAAPPPRVKGAAVFMQSNTGDVPVSLLHNLKHNRILHETIVFLTIVTERVPHVAAVNSLAVKSLGAGFWRVVGHYGFMDQPNAPDLLAKAVARGIPLRPAEASFYVSRETVLPSEKPGMALWRERLFGIMLRNANPASAYLGLRPNRVVELGAQVEI
jgi:KUP system potassium uptake protein